MEVRPCWASLFTYSHCPQAELRTRTLQKLRRETVLPRGSVRYPQRTGATALQGHRRRLLHGTEG